MTVAKGFRSGSVQTPGQVLFAATDGVTTRAVIDPDELWTYEAGAKLRLAGRTLSLEGALYLTDWSNIQLPFTTSAGLVATVNGGDARIKGIDLGLNWRTPLTGLSLQLAGSINEAKFTRVNAGLATTLPTVRVGLNVPNVPKGNVSLAAIYAAPITDSVNLNLYAAYAYRDRQQDLASGLYSANLDIVTLRAGIGNSRHQADRIRRQPPEREGAPAPDQLERAGDLPAPNRCVGRLRLLIGRCS